MNKKYIYNIDQASMLGWETTERKKKHTENRKTDTHEMGMQKSKMSHSESLGFWDW